jgi:hypothetical protein
LGNWVSQGPGDNARTEGGDGELCHRDAKHREKEESP